MTREELYELMEDGNLGYACVYKNGDQGMHTDYMFKMTAENIANFIGKNAFTADKIIMTDMCDCFICESVFGGFLMNCSDQTLCREIILPSGSNLDGRSRTQRLLGNNQRRNGGALGCRRRGSDASRI